MAQMIHKASTDVQVSTQFFEEEARKLDVVEEANMYIIKCYNLTDYWLNPDERVSILYWTVAHNNNNNNMTFLASSEIR